MHLGSLHGKLHLHDAPHGVQKQQSLLSHLPRPAINSAAAIRQHHHTAWHAIATSAATGRQTTTGLARPLALQAGSNSCSQRSSRLLLPSAAGLSGADPACSDDVAQQAQHACAAELSLLQELVQDAQQLHELLQRHPEVLQVQQHPSPLQAWVSSSSALKTT